MCMHIIFNKGASLNEGECIQIKYINIHHRISTVWNFHLSLIIHVVTSVLSTEASD